MRSIQRRFYKFKSQNPLLSSYTIFSKTIKHKQFSKDTISRWFNKIVEKADYDRKDKRKLVQYLCKFSNTPEEHTFKANNIIYLKDY